MENVYFDNAATTAIDPLVVNAMTEVMANFYGNPSSIHSHGRKARTLVEKARKTVASLLNTAPANIFFTSGGTEADNMAITCSIQSLGLTHAITSKLEHHAVLHTLQNLEKQGIIFLSFVQNDSKGNIDLQHLEQLLKTKPRTLVSLMQANNEIGTLTNIQTIGEICQTYNAIYHTDTVQTVGHYVHNLSNLNAHFIVCAAHKLHGPKGVGFLYINPTIKISPLVFGGAQERNMRGGTENIYAIVGLAKALELAYADMDEHKKHILALKNYMMQALKKHLPDCYFNGETDEDKSLYTVLNVSFPEMEMADMLLFNLDIHGISASGGSACSSGSSIGSHVLAGIHSNPKRPSIRFSFSKYNTFAEIDYVVKTLVAAKNL
ncbi:MAG: cysteine desulfurase [Sphingobacteriales bacterium]|nr:MAG: cysteine desulfurase [Sphingobacteriales bacterium]TAF83824.1 MAG: cysteine desulfurase [Sphingobacteriales bacterium]